MPPQSCWRLRNPLLAGFHTVEPYTFKFKAISLSFRASAAARTRRFTVFFGRVRRAFGTVSGFMREPAARQRRSYATEGVVICSPPPPPHSVATVPPPTGLLLHRSAAAAGMRLSHVLLNGDLMKRPQPLAHGASRCSAVVAPSAEELHEARNPPPSPPHRLN